MPLIAGSNATGPHPGVPDDGPAQDRRRDYNAAYLIQTDGAIAGRYDKMLLVPFGEYVPLAGWPVFSGLTPYAADDPGYAHGDPRQPLMKWEGATFGVLVCYEDVFPGLARRARRMGADCLLNLSSEAWFAGTAEIPQHFRISRFRAVENRAPLVRCCNVGVTAFVDPMGRTVLMLEGSDRPEGARGFISGPVPVGTGARGSLYVAVGDLFAWLSAAVGAAVVVLSLRRPSRSAPGGENRAKCA